MPLREVLFGASVDTVVPATRRGGAYSGNIHSHRRDGTGDSLTNETYRGRFQLVDDKTREPIANHPYTVTSADGQTIQGTTDASGHTDWLSTHQASSLTFNQPGSARTAGVEEA
ncbi:hypothetical protein NX869_28665, partial [Burkholderia thailandensis]|nr:hypothetical protein [Burkholderia thailandensis]